MEIGQFKTFDSIVLWLISLTCLRKTSMGADPKSAKKTNGLPVFFALLGSARVKALHKHVGGIDPGHRKLISILSIVYYLWVY